MKHPHIVALLCLAVPSGLAVALSCSKNESSADAPLVPGDGVDYTSSGGTEDPAASSSESEQGDPNARPPTREVTSNAEALQVLLTASDAEIAESEVAKNRARVDDVRAYAEDIIGELNDMTSRLRTVGARNGFTPIANALSDRMRFESASAVVHLQNLFPDMFDRAYMNRRVDLQKKLIESIDRDLIPVVTDSDFQDELSRIRGETQSRVQRAERVLSVLPSGNSSGLPTPPIHTGPTEAPAEEVPPPTVDPNYGGWNPTAPASDGGGAALPFETPPPSGFYNATPSR